jgi:hypothetical protein
VVIPFGSGTGKGSEPMGGEEYMASVHFPPAVYSHLTRLANDKNLSFEEMVVYVCKKGLDHLG